MRGVPTLLVCVALGLLQKSEGHFNVQHGHLRATDLKLQNDAKVIQLNPNNKGNSVIGGVILGLLLWWLVPVCLWNNERIAIKQYKMQLKAERYAIHIDGPEREPLEEMDGRIVYLTGTSTVSEDLADDKFKSVKCNDKIKLRRVVEMYQWIEKEHSDDNNTWYTYDKQWRDTHQSVDHDKDKKNPCMSMESTSRGESYRLSTACLNGSGDGCAEAKHSNVKVGAYYLGEYVIRELNNWKPKELSADMLEERTVGKGNERFMKGEAKLDEDGWWYFGSKNDVGDARVRFEELCPGPLTVVGVLSKTSTGWTFVPIMRADAKGVGDSFCAELGGSCCFRVKELHYDAEKLEQLDEELKEDLKDRAPELTKKEKGAFHRSQTSAEVKTYNPEEDIGDLCCVGPFGGVVVMLMHWIGLEEEFLGVSEKEEELDTVMSRESSEAAHRHHMMRIAGWFLLIFASFQIISPIIRLLNFHWLATLMGGGLISLVLICLACACSSGAFCCIVSLSWIKHRPFLGSVGIALCVLTFVGMYTFMNVEEQKSRGGAPAFLHLHNYASSFMALTQSIAHSQVQ